MTCPGAALCLSLIHISVADLRESQRGPALGVLSQRCPPDVRDDFTADYRETDGSPEPCGVPDELAAAHCLRILGFCILSHAVTTTVPCIIGWMEQT